MLKVVICRERDDSSVTLAAMRLNLSSEEQRGESHEFQPNDINRGIADPQAH